MAFMEVKFFSQALQVAVSVNVILPEAQQGIGMAGSARKKLPRVLYLLHGLSDDHSIWMRRTSVERYAAKQNLAVIMPAVNRSFYINERYGAAYWDFVSEELPKVMHTFFRLSNKPEDTFVAGLSMGGYGAMRLALTYPERYAAAGSFSGALDLAALGERRDKTELHRILGDDTSISGTDLDCFHLMKKNADAPKKPRLFVACGTADFLYDAHLKAVPALKENGWDVTHFEKPDAIHEWGFWDEMIAAFIPWALSKKK